MNGFTVPTNINNAVQGQQSGQVQGQQYGQVQAPTNYTSTNYMIPSENAVNLANAGDYDVMEELDHVYKRHDMFIGSNTGYHHDERILDMKNPNKLKFITQNISWAEGAERIYLEILTNGSDNVDISRRNGFDIGILDIKMNETVISIRNGGRPIPIQLHHTGKWTPEVIFGTLRSSSTFSEKKVRTGAGVNGYGAKLTNIFSKKFVVKVGDPFNQKEYYQEFSNNMKVINEPIITPYSGEPYVEISYEMDFQKFGCDKYPLEAFYLYARHAADISYSCKVPVVFNGIKFNGYDIHTYAMWMGDYNNNYIIHYEWPHGTPLIDKKIGNKTVKYTSDPRIMPIVELCVIDTPDNGTITSYVNSMITRQGGVHVDAAFAPIIKKILDMVNNIGNGKKTTSSRKFKLMPADIKRHLTIIMSCHLDNPGYKSNSKVFLSRPKPKITIDDSILNKIKKWDIIERSYADLNAKQMRSLVGKGKTNKKKNINDLEGYDAQYAGDKKYSHQCSLYIVEGKSAKTVAIKFIEYTKNGSKFFGVLPLKGKPLNVMKAGFEQYANNEEIKAIKEYLNIVEGVDYTIPENYATLRYGRVIWLCDSDYDGFHIGGLGMNIFYHKFNSLLKIPGYFSFMRTPIVKINKGKETYKFYTLDDLTNWENSRTDLKTWEYDYYKGLGRYEDADAQEEIQNPVISSFIYNQAEDPQYFNLVFGKKMEDNRKKWIIDHKPYHGIEKYKEEPLWAFLNYEVVKHSISSVREKIPSLMDGLKDSQRRIIFACYKHWGAKVGKLTGITKIKTGNLASKASDITNYIHGEKSLQGAINHMCHTYPGTNNMNLLFPHGDHGTRLENGKDAADARYTQTKPTWALPYLFRKEDTPILEYIFDEGKYVQPKWYLPILPLILVNGSRAIGTGFASLIPTFNTVEIVQALLNYLINGVPFPDLIPYCDGFNGTIEVKDKSEMTKKREVYTFVPPDLSEFNLDNNEENNKVDNTEDDNIRGFAEAFPDSITDEVKEQLEENDDPLGLDKIGFDKKSQSGLRMITTGKFHFEGNAVVVTEIPIGKSLDQYKKWLTTLRDEKDKEKLQINDFECEISSKYANFKIIGFPNPNYKTLRLITVLSMGNMTALNENNIPARYKTTKDIQQAFYDRRAPYYEKRKQHNIKDITEKIYQKELKVIFINAVILGTENGYIEGKTIIIMKQESKNILPQARSIGFTDEQTTKLLDTVKSRHYTFSEINKLNNDVLKLKAEKQRIIDTDSKVPWVNELNEFLVAYKKHGGLSKNDAK